MNRKKAQDMTSMEHKENKKSEGTSHIRSHVVEWVRFLATWIGISGAANAASVCPFCGQSVCPTYWGITAILGFMGAGFHWVLRRMGRKKK